MTNDDDPPVRPAELQGTDEPPPDGAAPSGAAPRRKKRARRRDESHAGAAPPAVTTSLPREVAIDDPAVVAVRRQLLAAAAAAAGGVALVGTGPSDVGMWIAVVGGIGLVASIHRLGRLGPPAVPGHGADGPPGGAAEAGRGA